MANAVKMNYKAIMTDESRATFTLRASRELLDRLKTAADERSHSMNAEIVQRLEASLDERNAPHIPETKEISESEKALLQTMRGLTTDEQEAVKEIARQLHEKPMRNKGPNIEQQLKNISYANQEVKYYLSCYPDPRSPYTKAALCRDIAKQVYSREDYFKTVAFALAAAGFEPTEERISFLTRQAERNPPMPNFTHLDLQSVNEDPDGE
ncbi:MAG: Arc family DNA-binding protein [Acetobacter papayae]